MATATTLSASLRTMDVVVLYAAYWGMILKTKYLSCRYLTIPPIIHTLFVGKDDWSINSECWNSPHNIYILKTFGYLIPPIFGLRPLRPLHLTLPPMVHVLLRQQPEIITTTNFWREGGRIMLSNSTNFCVWSLFHRIHPNGAGTLREF